MSANESRDRRFRLGERGALVALVAALVLAHPGSSRAASTTTIGFDDASANSQITSRYQGQGVTFGPPSDLGFSSPPGDSGACGPPTARSGDGKAFSGSTYAELAHCTANDSDDNAVFGRFDYPRSSVGAVVRTTVPGGNPNPDVTVAGYDGAGNQVASTSTGIGTVGDWISMTASQPAGQAPRIKYFAVYSFDGGDAQFGIDDLTFNNPPAAKLVLATPKALDHEVLALDGSGSRSGNPITKYAWDFDGDGHFDATCPGPMPVAYKLFDTPGVHNVALQVTDAIGHQSTSHTTITLGGKARRSIVRRAGTPSDLLHFWCGDRSGIARTNLSFLPHGFTSDVHAVGIDVTQGAVPTGPFAKSGAQGSKFTSFRAIAAGNFKEDPAENRIGYLARFGKTVARVYASALRAPRGDSVPNVQMKLYGVDPHGNPLPGSPLLSETGPLNVPVGPSYTTHAMRVGTDSGGGFLPAFTFTLPESWTSASEISLLARPVLVGARLDRQCSTPQCSFAQQRSIGGLRFSDTGLFVIRSVAMTYTGSPTLPDPVSAFDAASNLSPVAVLPSPYQATRDLTAIRKSCTKPDGSFCDAINDKVKADIDQWTNDNKPAIPPQVKVVTIGLHSGFGAAQGSSSWPGACSANASGGALCETSDSSPVSHVELDRPLTSVGHEMLHDLGRPHAGPSCGGGGPSWPPDQRGDLQGIGLDRHPGSGGSLANPYKLISPDIPGQPTEQYDLMSYCYGGTESGGTNCFETCAWISPRNWDTLAGEWVEFLRGPRIDYQVFAAAHAPALDVSGYADTTGVHISHLGTTAGPGGHPSGSPFHAIVRDGAGNLISDTALTATYGHSDNQRAGKPASPFIDLGGVVPSSPSAEKLALTRNGTVMTTVTRSAHAPAVRLLSPQHGRIGALPAIIVRWGASDSDGNALTAYVDYSTNAGHTWRTVFSGPSRGVAKLPRTYFGRSDNARIRVRVNDGFNETAAVSGRLRALGSPPTVRITSPRSRQRVSDDAAVYLSGQAFDDRFNALMGSHLRWYVGRRLVGKGIAVTASQIPPGKARIRLVARDRTGRTGEASVTIRSIAVRPFFTLLDAPAKLSRHARRLTLHVATDQATTLGIGHRSFLVHRRPRAITLGVVGGTATINLTLRLTAYHKVATLRLRVPRS